jgi:hypothetical protein
MHIEKRFRLPRWWSSKIVPVAGRRTPVTEALTQQHGGARAVLVFDRELPTMGRGGVIV